MAGGTGLRGDHGGLSGGRRLAAVIVVAGYGASLVANYPGHFTPDGLLQLAQGRSGVYNDWHPPVMAWLLGLADGITPGAWSFVVANDALFYGALLAFALLDPRPRPAGLALLGLWVLSPLVMIYQGAVLKDVLFANAAVAGFAALAWAGRWWERRARRWALLATAGLLFVLASLARQNGVVAALLGALAVAGLVLTRPPPGPASALRRLTRAAGSAVLALALVAAAVGAATAALETHSDGQPEILNHAKTLQTFDLAGAVNREPGYDLRELRRANPEQARFLVAFAGPRYRAAGADNLSNLPDGVRMMTPPGDAAARQWRRLILDRPDLYLAVRARVWLITLMTPPSALCPMVFTGVDGGDADLLRAAGLQARDDDKDGLDSDYVSLFLRTPLFCHAVYGLLSMAVLAIAARRWLRGDRRPERLATMALCLAGLAFAGSFFVLSIDCDYRFLYFLDVSAMVAAVAEAAGRPVIRLPAAEPQSRLRIRPDLPS
jgi:hypothetical protein